MSTRFLISTVWKTMRASLLVLQSMSRNEIRYRQWSIPSTSPPASHVFSKKWMKGRPLLWKNVASFCGQFRPSISLCNTGKFSPHSAIYHVFFLYTSCHTTYQYYNQTILYYRAFQRCCLVRLPNCRDRSTKQDTHTREKRMENRALLASTL